MTDSAPSPADPLDRWCTGLVDAITALRDPFNPFLRLGAPPATSTNAERLKTLARTWLTICGPHNISDVVTTIGNRYGEHHSFLSDLNRLAERLRSMEGELAALLEQYPVEGVTAGLITTSETIGQRGWLADTGVGDTHGNPVRFITIVAAWLRDALPPGTLIGGTTLVVGATEWRPIAGTWIRPFYSLASAMALTAQTKSAAAEREAAELRRREYEQQAARERDAKANLPARAADITRLEDENRQLKERLAAAAGPAAGTK